MLTRTTRDISSGSTELTVRPDWSTVADVILYRGPAGTTVLEDLAAGRRSEPPVGWPARFDPSGAYVYGPSPGAAGSTVVYDLRSGGVVASLPGEPRADFLWTDHDFVRARGDGFVAVLEDAGCGGTAVYAGDRLVTCVAGGEGAVLSPAGDRVALARITKPASTTGFDRNHEYEVMVVDAATGATSVLGSGARGMMAPQLVWNEAATHLLVRWPFSGFGP
jgi:hypothetical protein